MVINDTFQSRSVTLASFIANVQPADGQVFNLEDFSLVHDEDNDGVLNHLELAQGTDPFMPPVQQCTPVQEEIEIAAGEDAYIVNGRLLNDVRIQVDRQRRTGVIRYGYDTSLGTVTAAELLLTVGSDEGDGLITIHAVPDLQWLDTDLELSLPPLGAPVASMDEEWEQGEEYSFQLDPAAVTSDFTLVLSQEPSGDDVAFSSRETSARPLLKLSVERCE